MFLLFPQPALLKLSANLRQASSTRSLKLAGGDGWAPGFFATALCGFGFFVALFSLPPQRISCETF